MENINVSNFVKNIICYDLSSCRISNYIMRTNKMRKNAYYTLIPNIIMRVVTLSSLGHINVAFPIENNKLIPTICLNFLYECIENIDSYNYDVIHTLIIRVITEYTNINKKENTYDYWYDKQFYEDLLINKINRLDNNSFLIEFSIYIGLISNNITETMNNAYDFIKRYTDNSIKILIFINFSIIYYFINSNIDNTTINSIINEKLNVIIDIYTDGTIDRLITNKNHLYDKKKVLFMMIKYLNTNFDHNDFPHQKIKYLDDNLFITKIDDTPSFIPGYTSDQCFLLVLNIISNVKNRLPLLCHTHYSFLNYKHVNILISWIYFRYYDETYNHQFTLSINHIIGIDFLSQRLAIYLNK